LVRRFVFVAALILAALVAGRAEAQGALGIAAVVNDEAISVLDLAARTRIAIVGSNLEDSAETRQRLTPQVLRSLIDDRLKAQEAKRQGVEATTQEIGRRLEDLASQNGMSLPDFRALLQRSGIMEEALVDQIRTEIVWLKLVQRRLRPLINITEDEIDAELAHIAANRGKPEFLAAEIFLPVDTPQQDGEVRQTAERLLQQIREGAPFGSVARQFSEAATAAGGGVLGWVRPGQLDPALDTALQQLAPGQVTSIIRGTTGYYLLTLLDKRVTGEVRVEDGLVTIAQLLLPLPESATEQEIAAVETAARGAAAEAGDCGSLRAKATELGAAGPNEIRDVPIGELPEGLRRLAINLPLGRASEPQNLGGAIGVFMVCERAGSGEGGAPTRLELADRMALERLETLARGYLRDLRRQAYIDIRI
jgi:peptidyl-prolyl cis-trans isomerase SurA